jgi:subtilisin family serine protease
MEKLYRQLNWKVVSALIFLLFSSFTISAQELVAGVARIKVSQSLGRQLEGKSISRSASGEIITGVPSLDQLNKQHYVRGFKRLFPDAGKNEARHRKYGLHLWYELRTERGMAVSQLVQSYRADSQILAAEPVYKKSIIGSGNKTFGPVLSKVNSDVTALPDASNDPMLGAQWHYHNTGQTGGTPGADIHLLDAWKSETGNPNVIVGIIDGGVQTDHPDLAANIWVNGGEVAGNKIDDDNNGYVDDIRGYSFIDESPIILPDHHATHVAGTIAAVSNNGIGVAGIAGGSGKNDGVRLMTCAVFRDEAESDGFPEAYVYSADNGAVISQNSWGYTFPGIFEQAVLDAIDYFIAEAGKNEHGQQTGPMDGGLVIFSAGNANDEGNFYPAYYEPVLAVASTTHKDTRAQYSNYGSWIDLSAPGGETYANEAQGVVSTLAGSQYGSFMGTSMACPHVSGVAALLISKFGKDGFQPEALRQRLLQSVNSIDPLNPGFAGKLGKGRMNAAMALGQNDHTPPASIKDLAVADKDVGEITLTWTSPADESGFVASYDLRYSTSPITDADFTSATRAIGVPSPAPPGTTETFTVKDLAGGVVFYFAIRATDFECNISAMSNAVSETSALTPSITISPSSVTENLKTAEHSTRTFSIGNTGQGPLKFTITDPTGKNDFVSVAPAGGAVPPAGQQTITLSFDANGLLAGTYQQTITIENNTPGNNAVAMLVVLKVANNGAPIASVSAGNIDFKSAQAGTTLRKKITISNAGSDPLVISAVESDNPVFGADWDGSLQIGAFSSADLALTFTPAQPRSYTGQIRIHTNDPLNPVFHIQVAGEGLEQLPLVVTPTSFDETLEKGTWISRTLVLQNNGSQDRNFRLSLTDTQLATDERDAGVARKKTDLRWDSLSVRARRITEKHQARFLERSAEASGWVKPLSIAGEAKTSRTGYARTATVAADGMKQYSTGFEDFAAGPLGDQQNWFATQGWTVSSQNPGSGLQHFRGTSEVSGTGQKFALSPYILDEGTFPHFTNVSMKVNLDQAKGTSWQIVTQDEAFVGSRIRFNADGTIDALVIDSEYETHWQRVPVRTPSGYFDMAIEYNNWGSDTSGFPTYYLFINNQHVFSGTGLGFAIGQVAIVSTMETAGPVLDMDSFKHAASEYLPQFIKPSAQAGIIPAGTSIQLALEFDARVMRFGTYTSDVVVHLDETDSVTVPTTLEVTGDAAMFMEPYGIYMLLEKTETGMSELNFTNIGGQPVSYQLSSSLTGLNLSSESGTIPVRGEATVQVTFEGKPGIYLSAIRLQTSIEDFYVSEIPVDIVKYDDGAVFYAPAEVQFDIPAGAITAKNVQLRNDGKNSVSFALETAESAEWVTADPMEGTITDTPLELALTFDARELSAGTQRSYITFRTNDKNHLTHHMLLTLNVLPDTIHAGKIFMEQWNGIPGKEIASIPVNTSPSATTLLTSFESPQNTGDNYGTRTRGYVRAPLDGYYTFWIASNDHSELWLAQDEDPVFKVKIASVTGYTNSRQWDKYPTQMSQAIYLEANKKYYIEALHKEGTGSDHLAVGWRLPDQTMERPIPGIRLVPFGIEATNVAPVVRLISPSEGEKFSAPGVIEIKAEAEDADGTIAKVEFYQGASKLGADISAPYAFIWKNVPPGNYSVVAKATDNSGGVDSASVDVAVTEGQACAQAGYIVREQWSKISGTLISSIPLSTAPSFTETLTLFEGPANTGDNYGARVRGFLCVPLTGQYTFWISANDKSELWLSTDAYFENRVKIAFVSAYTGVREWTKYTSQQSLPVTLKAGQKYYVEALHKEGIGSDHFAVGWQLPDGTLERPVPGIRLLPFQSSDNQPPIVSVASPQNGATFFTPATVEISAQASDPDGVISKVEFYNGNVKLGADLAAPFTFHWTNVLPGTYSLTAVATDNESAATASSAVTITVEAMCSAAGSITREFWTGISGTQVSSIPVNTPPDGNEKLTVFEGPAGAGSNYGARIRGYICPPASGEYYFWISSNDHSELWLSTNADPANKSRIASVTGATGVQEWTKFPSQKSAAITLTKGKTYYVEALHKQGIGTDHVAVGWQLPDGSLERPINGSRLSPINPSSATLAGNPGDVDESPGIQAYPNPVDAHKLTVSLANLSGEADRTKDIEIRQLTGLIVYSQKVNCGEDCTTEISLDKNFSPGIYILQVRVNGKTFSEKLIVK